MSDFITLADAVSIGEIVRMAQGCKKVARATGDGDVLYGTARSIGAPNGTFLKARENILDAYLRVTLSSGLEAFWPVRLLMPLVSSGEFKQYDW